MGTWIKAPDNLGTCCDCQPAVCDPCNPCPTISHVVCWSRGATKTKCGFDEFPGHVSSPPRIYSEIVLAGSLSSTNYATSPCVEESCLSRGVSTYSGTCTFDRVACDYTTVGNRQLDTYGAGCAYEGTVHHDVCRMDDNDGPGSTAFTETLSATVRTLTGTGCDGLGKFEGVATETLASEFTTAQLELDCEDAVVAASWINFGTCTALRSLSSDETTITLRELEYVVHFSAPTAEGCKLEWDIYLNGSFSFRDCINLPSGITSFPVSVGWPSSSGAYTAQDFTITHATC